MAGVFGEMQSALNAIWKAKPESGTVSRLVRARAPNRGRAIFLRGGADTVASWLSAGPRERPEGTAIELSTAVLTLASGALYARFGAASFGIIAGLCA